MKSAVRNTISVILASIGLNLGGNSLARDVSATAPKEVEALMLSGHRNYDRRDLQKAKECFARAIAIKPQHALAYACRGDCYSDLHEYTAAIGDYTRALSLGALLPSEKSFVSGLRGQLRLMAGDLDGARADFDMSLQHSGDLYFVYLLRAQVRNAQGDFSGSIKDCDKAQSLVKITDARILVIKGWDEIHLGLFEPGVRDLLQVCRLNPRLIFANGFGLNG